MICVLNVVRGPAKQCRYVLHENQAVEIGRSPQADISVPTDVQLSRRHVLIHSKGGIFSICDLGSSNGTFVNEERVNRTEIATGDIIRIGKTHLQVTLMNDDANPHAEDGVQFASTGFRGTDQQSRNRTERSVSFPDEFASQERTRVAPRETFGDEPFPSVTQSLEVDVKALTFRSLLSQYFVADPQSNLYRARQRLESPWGEFAGMLRALAGKGYLLSVFNVAQMDTEVAQALEKLLEKQQLISLSKTLLAGNLGTTDADLRLLSKCTGRDGLICIGSSDRIAPEELKPFANSLSYPSMYGEYIRDSDSPISGFLRTRRAWALFEWSSAGPLGLFAAADN
ncbi:MAG: FHA domain-containing protein [Planctomycetota bacterium]|jgi:predicted component of type VI protein secretion system